MISIEEIEKVLQAMDKADPDAEDEELEAIRNGLCFALGERGTADSFIRNYVSDE